MYKTKQKGFTLIEIVGVMAVIAIIASIAAPRIFGAIQDAKVTALVGQAKTLGVTATSFYNDTGKWPVHDPKSTDDKRQQLMVNKGGNGQPIIGWDGPYLDQEISNIISPSANHILTPTSTPTYTCDLDGNGTSDGSFLVYYVHGISDTIARKASNILDKDGNEETGDTSWKKAGRVKRYNGDNTSILVFCLGRI
ncbi:MAG: prepilin-type N-terminal cleavage/methylation domain-containing protein [Granulosicoccus sp.]